MHKGLSQTLRVVADLLRWEETGILGDGGGGGGWHGKFKSCYKGFSFFLLSVCSLWVSDKQEKVTWNRQITVKTQVIVSHE